MLIWSFHKYSYYYFCNVFTDDLTFIVSQQISLDPPIKQGQTRYHFLILLFSKEENINLALNMSEWV